MNKGIVTLFSADFMLSFFASKLYDIGKKNPNWNMFGMQENIPYIAEVLATFMFCKDFDPDSLAYRFIRAADLGGDCMVLFDDFTVLEPIALREIADAALFTRAFMGRYPKFIFGYNSACRVSGFYKKLSELYPDDRLRVQFSSIYTNIYPWLEILPNLRSSINMVIR